MGQGVVGQAEAGWSRTGQGGLGMVGQGGVGWAKQSSLVCGMQCGQGTPSGWWGGEGWTAGTSGWSTSGRRLGQDRAGQGRVEKAGAQRGEMRLIASAARSGKESTQTAFVTGLCAWYWPQAALHGDFNVDAAFLFCTHVQTPHLTRPTQCDLPLCFHLRSCCTATCTGTAGNRTSSCTAVTIAAPIATTCARARRTCSCRSGSSLGSWRRRCVL